MVVTNRKRNKNLKDKKNSDKWSIDFGERIYLKTLSNHRNNSG